MNYKAIVEQVQDVIELPEIGLGFLYTRKDETFQEAAAKDQSNGFALLLPFPIGYTLPGATADSGIANMQIDFALPSAPDLDEWARLDIVQQAHDKAMLFIELWAGLDIGMRITRARIEPVHYYNFGSQVWAGVYLNIDVIIPGAFNFC